MTRLYPPFERSRRQQMTFTNFGRMVFSRCLVAGWAILIAGALNLAQAQYAPPPPPPVPPPPPPVFNPSPSNTTVPQPSYKSISPTTPSGVPGDEITSPVNEEHPSTTARSERTSVANTRSFHHHYHRGRVRIYPWAYYASVRWFPGYYDYAPGQLGRGRPRYSGWPRRYGYHGD